MASKDMLSQLLQGVVANPSLLGSITEHPYDTIREATGTTDQLSRQDASELLAAFSAIAGGQQLDFGSLGTTASGLLEQNDNSVHSVATSLFGSLLGGLGGATAAPKAEAAAAAGGSGAAAAIIQNLVKALATSELGGIKGVDLSDGFGLDDVLGIAKNLL